MVLLLVLICQTMKRFLFCEDCQFGKIARSKHLSTVKRPSVNGEVGIGGGKYCMLIKDEVTTFRFTDLLKAKHEVHECLSSFIPLTHRMNGAQIKYFRFDNGKEFVNQNVKKSLSSNGIQVEYITPYTQNGRIERENRTIRESARTMLIARGLPKFLWPEAVRTVCWHYAV